MDWITLISALAGTIVGGLITVIGQALADRRREGAAVRSERRAATLAVIERRRCHAIELHDRALSDMSELSTRVSESNEYVNQDRAELLGHVLRDLSERHGRAGALIAVVENDEVRESVDDYYTIFGLFLVAEEQQMLGQLVQQKILVEEIWGKRDQATQAVRGYLRSLGDEETATFAAHTRLDTL